MLVPVTAVAKAVPVVAEDREAVVVALVAAVVPVAEIVPTPGHLLSRSSRYPAARWRGLPPWPASSSHSAPSA